MTLALVRRSTAPVLRQLPGYWDNMRASYYEFRESKRCMPIYLYTCNNCGHELEALQKISDPPFQECPACGSATLQKQVTAAAFRLKGTGWYETDFKSKDKKPADKKKPKEEKTTKQSGGDSSKSDKSSDMKSGNKKSATGAKGG